MSLKFVKMRVLCVAALLGLVNELVGGSLIAPSGLELRPTAATMQWAELVGSQEVLPQAWAAIGISVSQQVKDQVHTHDYDLVVIGLMYKATSMAASNSC